MPSTSRTGQSRREVPALLMGQLNPTAMTADRLVHELAHQVIQGLRKELLRGD